MPCGGAAVQVVGGPEAVTVLEAKAGAGATAAGAKAVDAEVEEVAKEASVSEAALEVRGA